MGCHTLKKGSTEIKGHRITDYTYCSSFLANPIGEPQGKNSFFAVVIVKDPQGFQTRPAFTFLKVNEAVPNNHKRMHPKYGYADRCCTAYKRVWHRCGFLLVDKRLSINRMAKERQKWTLEEEEALFYGVGKHGQGKWKVILTDPQFASALANRSNIDLKDKWRNVSVNRDKVRTPMLEGVTTTTITTNPPLNSPKIRTPLLEGVTTTTTTTITTNPPMSFPKPLSVVHLLDYGGMSVPSSSTMDETTPPVYEKLILEALSSIGDPNGSNTNAILSFIEKNFPVPENFERSVTSMLRRLVLTGKIEMVDNNFKYKGASSGFKRDDSKNDKLDDDEKQEAPDAPDSPIATETLEDAAFYAARLVARAENVEQEAIEACQESDRIAKMLEESMAMLQLAEELHEMCLKDGFVLLAL
ncbi:unnamed protein product [Lactuca virosa]|uniref:MYB transcription factor n=1 Tax=Lactuca virosa TaxID=75947 RepID=A0AAU9M6T7_9ASTR|nr:unnamed protein product [Lactuca virosa]